MKFSSGNFLRRDRAFLVLFRCGRQQIQRFQHFFQRWIIAHILGVMFETNVPFFIHNHQRGHSSEFQQTHFLFVLFCDMMLRVCESDKWHLVRRPKQFECRRAIRTNRQNFRIAFYKFLIVLTQLRQMLAAVWSSESAQKRQHDIFFGAKIRQANFVAIRIGQCKVRCDFHIFLFT